MIRFRLSYGAEAPWVYAVCLEQTVLAHYGFSNVVTLFGVKSVEVAFDVEA